MNNKDLICNRMEECFESASNKSICDDFLTLRFFFSQFVTNLAMLWLLCDGRCETLKKAELEELTYSFTFSKGMMLLEDQWVQESLYQLYPEWNIKETFALVYNDYERKTNPLLGAAKIASGNNIMPSPVTT